MPPGDALSWAISDAADFRHACADVRQQSRVRRLGHRETLETPDLATDSSMGQPLSSALPVTANCRNGTSEVFYPMELNIVG